MHVGCERAFEKRRACHVDGDEAVAVCVIPVMAGEEWLYGVCGIVASFSGGGRP